MLTLSNQLLDQLLGIINQAGEYLIQFYTKSLDIQMKSDNTPVTNADLFISRFLTEELTKLTPNIPVLSEENCDISLEERKAWQAYWIIDPLDGTHHFINHTDQFSILVALIQNHQPILGIAHAPILETTYYAVKGQGAFKVKNGQTQRLCMREISKQQPIRIVLGSLSAQQKVRSILNPNYQYEFYAYGSSGLKGAMVAEGQYDCYVRLGKTGEWDTAVAELLLGEVGGVIYDTHFKPLSYNERETLINPHFIMLGDRNINWQDIFHFN